MKYILGNWKMNGLTQHAEALAKAIAVRPLSDSAEVALFPPFTYLHNVHTALKGSKVKLGAQDVSPEKEGAFTGDISAPMLKDVGCEYVLIGHSERRILHSETDKLVKKKAIAAIASGLKPVICVGENCKEREDGKYIEAITRQIKDSLPLLEHSNSYLIAYEPIWAIGSGKTPTIKEIEEVHKTIASLLYRGTSVTTQTAILYGGSVKAQNAGEIMQSNGVDGVLVGGASLNAEEFAKIIAAANH